MPSVLGEKALSIFHYSSSPCHLIGCRHNSDCQSASEGRKSLVPLFRLPVRQLLPLRTFSEVVSTPALSHSDFPCASTPPPHDWLDAADINFHSLLRRCKWKQHKRSFRVSGKQAVAPDTTNGLKVYPWFYSTSKETSLFFSASPINPDQQQDREGPKIHLALFKRLGQMQMPLATPHLRTPLFFCPVLFAQGDVSRVLVEPSPREWVGEKARTLQVFPVTKMPRSEVPIGNMCISRPPGLLSIFSVFTSSHILALDR